MGIFGKNRDKAHPLADTAVWIVPLHIKSGDASLPPPLIGAYVQVITGGETATLAAWGAIQAIEAMGFSVPDDPATVHQMRAADYASYVADNWGELANELPVQSEFYDRLAQNRATIGPFAGYDAPADP